MGRIKIEKIVKLKDDKFKIDIKHGNKKLGTSVIFGITPPEGGGCLECIFRNQEGHCCYNEKINHAYCLCSPIKTKLMTLGYIKIFDYISVLKYGNN